MSVTKLVPKLDNSISDPITKYSNVIPDIISDAISGLNNKNYRAVVVILDIEGKKSFTELREKLNLNKDQSNKLSYWLDKLEEEGLVVNDIIKIPDRRESSFYSLSRFGKDLLDKILEAYINYISPSVAIPKGETLEELDPTSSLDIPLEFNSTTNTYQAPLLRIIKKDERRMEMVEIGG